MNKSIKFKPPKKWTKIDLTLDEQKLRAKELLRSASSSHTMVKEHHGKMLDYAKLAGDDLLEAHDLVGWGDWGDWLSHHFSASERTARNYMRIAEHWNDPRLVKARKDGLTIDSISTVLKILCNERLEPDSKKPTILEMARSDIRQVFANWVKNLGRAEIDILSRCQVRWQMKWHRWLRKRAAAQKEKEKAA